MRFPTAADKEDYVSGGWSGDAASDVIKVVPRVDEKWSTTADESHLEGGRDNDGGN